MKVFHPAKPIAGLTLTVRAVNFHEEVPQTIPKWGQVGFQKNKALNARVISVQYLEGGPNVQSEVQHSHSGQGDDGCSSWVCLQLRSQVMEIHRRV